MCPLCHNEHEGFCVELGCGCIERSDGRRFACMPEHEFPCRSCGANKKQAYDNMCGPCRADEEFEHRRDFKTMLYKKLEAAGFDVWPGLVEFRYDESERS